MVINFNNKKINFIFSDKQIYSTAVKYNYVSNWQSLVDNEKLIFLHNRQHNSVLDLKTQQ